MTRVHSTLQTATLLAGVLVLAILLRLYQLNYQSMWVDEVYSIIPSTPEHSFKYIFENCTDQPPLYYIVLNAWFKVFPYNDYYGRLLSALIGVVGVLSMYFLGVEIKSRAVGLVASFVTAWSIFHIQYSQETRFYALLFLLSAVSYLFFIKAFRRPSLLNFLFYTITSVLLAYTHYFGPVVIIAQAFTFLVFVFLRKRELKFIIYGIMSGLTILLMYIPWFPIIFSHSQITEFWAMKPDPLFWGLYYYVYLGKDPYLALLYVVLIGVAVRQVIKQHNKAEEKASGALSDKDVLVILGLCLFISYLVPYLYSIIKTPILDAKYTINVLPIVLVMSAWGWSAIPKPTFRKVILATIAVSTIVNLIFFNKYYSTIRKEQMREAVLFVINSSKKADPVYGRLAWFFNYYFRQYKSPTVVVNPTEDHPDFRSLDFNTELAEKKGVWVLQVHLVSALTPVQQEYLDQHYVVDQKADFFYAYAYHYRRKEDTGKPD